MEKKIIEAEIFRQPRTNFLIAGDIVMVRYEGEEHLTDLFSFYPDEIQFYTDDFIGLTEAEAFRLKRNRDRNYLQS